MAGAYAATQQQVALSDVGESSSAHAPSLRQFTLDFFGFFGATLAEDPRAPGAVQIDLDDALAQHFGAERLFVCFEHADAGPECELMARGSRLYDLMLGYLRGRSAATVLELPRRYSGSEELMQAVRPLNASILDLKMRETHQNFYLFNWHLTFRSDEKHEELYSVLLNDDGERVPLAGSAEAGSSVPSLEELFADGEAMKAAEYAESEAGESESTAAKLPPMTQLARLAETARKFSVYYADTLSAAQEAEILPRLYRTLSRITTYYEQQIEEVYETHDRDGEKRLSLQQDMERKIAEEVENHRLRVGVRLFSYAVFQAPAAVAEMTLSDGVRSARVQVTHNRYAGTLERPRCHACGEEAAAVAVDRYGHITCDDCIRQCATCREVVCAACGVRPCPVCGKESCETCGETCWACGERACADHIGTCQVCGDRVCGACMDECSACGARQCRSHLLSDAVVSDDGTYALICEACAVRCPGCRQYSARVGVCEASGQRFCRNCLVVCAECGGVVGPGYYERSSVDGRVVCTRCMQPCPSCGRRTPDTENCERCGAAFCPTCGLRCDVCGGHCCNGRYERFARCGHVVCADHETHCSTGGEVICAVCSETCGVCEQPYCNTHSLRCRHCGQQYCGNCIGISGLCATCESLATDDAAAVDVNMSEEPCAADLEVSAMARHYRWKRASNSRYVIYEGRNPLMGGVVAVAEVRRGGSNVVALRRFSLIELLRNRLFGHSADE